MPLGGDWERVGERGGRAGGRSEVKESEVEAREVEEAEKFVGATEDCCSC